MKHLITLTLFSSILCAASVLADTYIHGSLGEAEFSSGGEPDMYDIGLGFDLSEHLSVEFNHVDLGTVESNIGAGEFLEEEADGFNAVLVANIPVNDMLSFYVSAGRLRWEDTARYYIDGEHIDTYVVKDKDWNYGAGVKAQLYDGLELKFGYTEYKLDDIDVDSITAGIVYRF